jgi:uncharacterized damage-inducible protein DinB
MRRKRWTMKKKPQDPLRKELLWLLDGGGAHATFDEAIEAIDKEYYGAPVKGLPYTLWRVIEHMRLSQRDILDYIQDPNYEEQAWPDYYWPKAKSPPNPTAWDTSVAQIRADLAEFKKHVLNPKTNLLEPIPHIKNGPTLLHEIFLVVDHNSYHIGQIILLRGWLGIWED